MKDSSVNMEMLTNKSVAGVAVTLMLHAPTWFQRRYSMMVLNVHNNVPDDWIIQIFYTAQGQSLAGIEINRAIGRLVEKGRIILTTIPKEVLSVKRKRFELMTELWIWKNMLSEKVLLFGGGTVICSNSVRTVSDFLKFDYIGAPWNAFKGMGGDGSISIRSKSVMVAAIEYELSKHSDVELRAVAYKNWGQEDHFFVSRILEMQRNGLLLNTRVATRNDSMMFAAIGSIYNHDVFAVSGTIPDIPFGERDKFLALCPEIKMFYPSLHDPHCFGAQPDGEKCAKSICALKNKTERKGGC